MDKKDANLKKLVRPTAARPKSTGSTTESTAEGSKNGSGASSASPSTSDLVKKLSLNSAISPLNANRPGRLPSFRGERDLTLGGSRGNLNPLASGDGGAKSKKEFKPTIPARRTKAQESLPVKEEKFAEPSSRGRGRRDGPTRGRGRGRPELIQTTGSIFGEGVANLEMKARSSSSYADDRDGHSSGALEKPQLKNTKINKEEEDAALNALLRDDFIDDNELGDGYDYDMILQPMQLPKSSFSDVVKAEEGTIKSESTENKSVVELPGGIKIKEEKCENALVTGKTSLYQRRLKPSQILGEDIFQKDGDILFIQLPDVLPSLQADKERPQVKIEPGTKQGTSNEPATPDLQSVKEGVFEDIPEGRLGSLRIHKSGKISLQMGEHSFVLDSATQVSYLQDLISVDVNAEEKTGKMRALGPIKYKAICLPDWDSLIEDS